MSTAAVATRVTPEQYLALERASPTKHQYFDGRIEAMPGASRLHNLIAINLCREISLQFEDRPCEIYGSDMRVCVAPTGLYTYPDVSAVCGEPQFLDSEVDTLLNPTALIEILSPSTEANDRGRKAANYRRLASLGELVLVAQDRARVEHYARRGEDWLMTELVGLDDLLRLDSIGCVVPLRRIYAKTAISDA